MYLHEVICTPNHKYLCLSVVNTWDCGWECAYSLFDPEAMTEWWGDKSWRAADIYEYGEEAGAFDCWTVVKSHCRTPESAERALRTHVAKAFAKKP